MKPVVIILNGFPRSGKDTFSEIASNRYVCINHSTVDTIKKIARKFGWDGSKTERNRDMLSALKDFSTFWFDGPYNEITELIVSEVFHNNNLYMNRSYDSMLDFLFIHSREPREIKRVVEFCESIDVECYTVFIMREEVDNIPHANHADTGVANMIYDVYIGNNGTIELFEENVLGLLDAIMSGSLKNWTNYKEE